MWGFAAVCRVAAATLGLLLGAVLLRDHSRDRSARASAFLILTVLAHLVFPVLLQARPPLLVLHAVLLVSLSVPFAFWLLAEIHFDDEFRLHPAHAALLVGLVAAGYASWLVAVERRVEGGWFGEAYGDFWLAAPKLLSVAVVVHAMIRVYVGAGSDLLVHRLKLRYGVLVAAGTYILVELLGEILFRGSASAALADRVYGAAVLAFVFVVSFLALRTAPQILKPPRLIADTPAVDPVLLDRLKRLIEGDEIFREEGLTIGALAQRMGQQEHTVRRLINSELGFKNFNVFLHHFRVREAQKVLSDPSKRHLNVAEIAYGVGYTSLGPFNKAFRDITGLTPTEFRKPRPD